MRSVCSSITLLVVLLLALAAVFDVHAQSEPEDALPDDVQAASLVDVIDGDTLDVELEGSHEIVRVRLIGIDAPETSYAYGNEPECYGDESSRFADGLLESQQQVWLEMSVEPEDYYDRLLRYVWFVSASSGEVEMMNEVLVREGYAEARTYEPNTTRQDDLDEAEEDARESGAGMWSECDANGNPVDTGDNGNNASQDTDGDEDRPEINVSSEAFACSFFASALEAQVFMLAYPDMANELDPDNDGEACSNFNGFDT